MTDKAIQNAQARRQALVAEVNALEAKAAGLKHGIEEIDRFIRAWHEFASAPVVEGKPDEQTVPDAIGAAGDTPAATGAKLSRSGLQNPKKEDVAEAVRELIVHYGRPIAKDELLQLLAQRGMTIRGSDPTAVLGTMLWRMKDRVVLLKTGYWLREKPYTAAGYMPPDAPQPSIEEMLR